MIQLELSAALGLAFGLGVVIGMVIAFALSSEPTPHEADRNG